jgi:hypothetical protein
METETPSNPSRPSCESTFRADTSHTPSSMVDNSYFLSNLEVVGRNFIERLPELYFSFSMSQYDYMVPSGQWLRLVDGRLVGRLSHEAKEVNLFRHISLRNRKALPSKLTRVPESTFR